jgi:hypothetical protein
MFSSRARARSSNQASGRSQSQHKEGNSRPRRERDEIAPDYFMLNPPTAASIAFDEQIAEIE